MTDDVLSRSRPPLMGTFNRYIVRVFLIYFFFLLVLVTGVLQLIELMTHWSRIALKNEDALGALAQFCWWRWPGLVTKFAPYVALLAVLATFSGLRTRSELTAIRASGRSSWQIVAPLVLACAAIGTAQLILQEAVSVGFAGKLSRWEKRDFATRPPPTIDFATDIHFASGSLIVRADSARRLPDRVVLENFTAYGRDSSRDVQVSLHAKSAVFERGIWTLINVTRIAVGNVDAMWSEREQWTTPLKPGTLFAAELDSIDMPLSRLLDRIGSGQPGSSAVRQDLAVLYHRLTAPFAVLIMPLLGAVAGFGATRRGDQLLRLAFGLAIGVSYFITENLIFALGKTGEVPPLLSAVGASAIFSVGGLYALFALDETLAAIKRIKVPGAN